MIRSAVAIAGALALVMSAEAGEAARKTKKHAGKPARGAKVATPTVAPLPPPPKGSITPEAEQLGRGVRLLWARDLAAAKRELQPLVEPPPKGPGNRLHNPDYALYHLAQAELLGGEPEAALAHFDRVAHMKSRFTGVALARAADAARASGQKETAKRLYESALTHPSPDLDVTVCRYQLAELAAPGDSANAQQRSKAATAFRKVYVDYPMHPLAEQALLRMTTLDPSQGISSADRVARAKTMTANRGWPSAIAELDKLPNDLSPSLRDEADYWYGTTLFRMRRNYDVAAQKLLSVWSRMPSDERKAEALFHGARAKSRADLDDEAIVGYRDVVARFPRGKNTPEASFLIGWLDFNRAKYKEAIPSLQETLKRYGSSAFGDDARWYLGFSRWLSGDTEAALGDFNKLSEGRGDLSAGKGQYWAAMALTKLGRTDEASKLFETIARERPFTFYAFLARMRLKAGGYDLDAFGRVGAEVEKPQVVSIPELGREPDRTVARDAAVQRVDELLAAGLPVEASFELQRVENDLLRRFGAPKVLPLLFDRYQRGQDFYRIHRLAEAHAGRALAADPYLVEAARPWWELVYPRAYRAFVEKHAPSGKNPTYYLYTIMQKESAYNPHDVSYADAIGLLQMIPPTSRRVADRIGVPYTDDLLYDPESNIQFGAWYIGRLLQKFKGQIAIGAGSYNAGPKAMMKWLDKNGTRPLDEFVELCPYTQTREYMKKALAIYARYEWLYDRKDYLPSLTVDADYIKDDVDY